MATLSLLMLLVALCMPVAQAMPALPTSWSLSSSPAIGTGITGLSGVAAISASDVWAVGSFIGSGGSPQTLAEQWNGASWKVVSSPNANISDSDSLQSVAAVSASDVWAVGGDSTAHQPLIEQWNGTAWKLVSSPSVSGFATLNGIAAVSATDLWAVGASDTGAVIEQWTGSKWTLVPSQSIGQGDGFYSVAAISANDIWAVGNYSGTSSTQTLVEHWNGTSWSVVSSPSPGTSSNTLMSVSADSTGDVWAVGNDSASGGNPQTLVEHWNGTSWSVVTSPNVGTQGVFLTSVAAVSPSDVWAAGSYTTPSFAFQTLSEHWNGTAWSVVFSPSNGPNDTLSGIGAVAGSASDLWAVGAGNTQQALIEHYGYLLAPASLTRPLRGTWQRGVW